MPPRHPLTQAPAGSSVQSIADSQGKGNNWQDIAAANNIENPRMLQPGQLLDMEASVGTSLGGGVAQAGVSFGVSGGVQGSLSVSGSTSIGG